jgi:hypothetical protein
MVNPQNRKRPIQEEAQKWLFYNSHCYELQNQISGSIFDGWTQSFVIGSII